jgi:diaminopimelate decarboxylase
MPKPLSRIIHALLNILKNRERPLPSKMVRTYVQSLLEKREYLVESAARFGTPQYLYDEPALAHSLARFHHAFSQRIERLRLFYAVKSNSFPGLCKFVSDAGHGLDVSSGLELSTALKAGCRSIVFSGPGKTEDEIRFALAHRDKVTILMDSVGEMERIATVATEGWFSNTPAKVGVRIRGKHHGLWDKFGIPLEDLSTFFQKAASVPSVHLEGVQFHTSWNRDPRSQVEMIRALGAFLKHKLPKKDRAKLRFLDIGGGYWPERGEWLNPQNTWWGKLLLLIDPAHALENRHYYLEAKPVEVFAAEISRALSLQGNPLSDLEIWMEPGRWISTPAMHILLQVVDRKDGGIIITDGGINLLGWERPITEFIPVLNMSRPSLEEIPARIFGSLCTPLDIWGASCFGKDVLPGDILLIPDQGSYTYSLRQSFIKSVAPVVRYDGIALSEVEPEEHSWKISLHRIGIT